MIKLRSKILGVMGVVAVAGAMAATGLTAASASQVGAPGSSGFEHFQLVNATVANNAPSSIIARGVFTAGGVDHPGNTVDTAVFANGTFKIAHSGGTGTPRFNPRTCLGVITLNGTYRLSGGTGAYAGISGHGIYRLNILTVAARNAAGKCSNKLPPVAFQQIIRAQGPVSL
jgi:hypothetical protein